MASGNDGADYNVVDEARKRLRAIREEEYTQKYELKVAKADRALFKYTGFEQPRSGITADTRNRALNIFRKEDRKQYDLMMSHITAEKLLTTNELSAWVSEWSNECFVCKVDELTGKWFEQCSDTESRDSDDDKSVEHEAADTKVRGEAVAGQLKGELNAAHADVDSRVDVVADIEEWTMGDDM